MERPSPHFPACLVLVLAVAGADLKPACAQVAVQAIEPARAAIRVKNYADAAAKLRVLADRGDPQAQYLLASLYRAGLGVRSDPAQARALMSAAAQHGHAAAAYSLAAILANEEPRDLAEARAWLERAADAGHTLARAAVERGALPLQFLPQKDLSESDARRAALWLAAQQDDRELTAALADAETLKRTDDFGRSVLAVAAQAGAARAVTLLLERGASPDQTDAFGITPLMLAARSGNATVVAALLHARAAPDVVDRVGNSALMYAAASGSEASVRSLLAGGANAAATNAQGWNALDWAVRADATAAAELLRQRGVSTRRKPQHVAGSPGVPLLRASDAAGDLYKGVPDLQVAASRSSPALFEDVLRYQRESARTTSIPEGALFAAAVTGSAATLDAVLAAGAKASAARASDPLHWLAMRGSPDALTTLLARRPDTAGDSTAPLLVAVTARRTQVVRQLLETHADTEARDANGRTALMLAAASGQADVAGQLLSHLARMDPTDKLGRTALWYASAAGATDVAKALLTQQSVLNVPDVLGFTPLAIASARGHASVTDALLAAAADPDAPTQSDTTPLMLAAGAGHAPVVAKLLAAGARVDSQNRYGDTALIVAVRAGQVETVRQLLAAGASDKLRNADRVSALDVANALVLPRISALLQRD
jgi:ankyrin repeat protein